MKRQSLESVCFKDLGFSYDNQEKVFAKFTHEFKSGETLFIQGPRGSGKNTFIRLLLGLLSPMEGEYLINGVCVNEFGHDEFDPFRLNIGYSFDVGGLINNQTLYENFRFLLDYHGFQNPSERFDYIVRMMEVFHLDQQKHLRPAFISSSSSKAAGVLRAFALKPEMLILDNPTQGMSMEHIPALVGLIHEHQKEHNLKYVIISSDDQGFIAQLQGKVVRVTASGLL